MVLFADLGIAEVLLAYTSLAITISLPWLIAMERRLSRIEATLETRTEAEAKHEHEYEGLTEKVRNIEISMAKCPTCELEG